MASEAEELSSQEAYIETPRGRKRRRTKRSSAHQKPSIQRVESPEPERFSFEHLADALGAIPTDPTGTYDSIFDIVATDYNAIRFQFLWQNADMDPNQKRTIRALTLSEINTNIREIQTRGELTPAERLLIYRLKAIARRRYDRVQKYAPKQVVEAEPFESPFPDPPPGVLDGLYSIITTQYENSFASRLYGKSSPWHSEGIHLRDWQTRPIWLQMCEEIRLHYLLRCPSAEHAESQDSTIDYGFMLQCDLQQVHELLRRVFWDGISVSDIMDAPQNCTIVARYKGLAVGVALLSAPGETYITYVAIRPGWDYSRIATFMIYLLIKKNPRKDIFLHVSANNPAMLLYNQFGFKAEEFIVGFYDNYLPANSKVSKNAFRLRLRQY